MLVFMTPGDDTAFNHLNNATQNEVFTVSNGHGDSVKSELSGAPPVPAAGSPNNNTLPALAAAMTSVLDNGCGVAPAPPLPSQPPPPLPAERPLLPHEVSLMEESYNSDDTTTNESSLLLRADPPAAAGDGPVSPPSPAEAARGSPASDDRQPLLPTAATPTTTTVPGKTGKLKRVSFGSSKGSMVETVVYDYEPAQPLKEEDGCESPVPAPRGGGFTTSTPLSTATRPEPSAAERAASRVRVTYFESRKPLVVPAVETSGDTSDELDALLQGSAADTPLLLRSSPDAPAHTQVTASAGEMPTTYIVQTIDAGWENPFRPGGELSKEADQIVRAIQSGRPLDSSLDEADAAAAGLTATSSDAAQSAPANGGPAGTAAEPIVSATVQATVAAAPPGARDGPGPQKTTTPQASGAGHRNGGSAAPATQTAVAAAPASGTVHVQHTLVKPEDASQVEQVTLKKKPRGKCCVVQ